MIKDKISRLADVLPQALKLSALDKLKLVEQLALTLENDLASVDIAKASSRSAQPSTWGAQVLDRLDTMDTSEWEAMDIPDVVEWVKAQRQIISKI